MRVLRCTDFVLPTGYWRVSWSDLDSGRWRDCGWVQPMDYDPGYVISVIRNGHYFELSG